MVLLGGPVLQGFAFVMLVGIIVGTYSSIYIASSFVLWFIQKIKKIDVEIELAKKSSILGKAKA
jgi:preprotein translocase subunit SecF